MISGPCIKTHHQHSGSSYSPKPDLYSPALVIHPHLPWSSRWWQFSPQKLHNLSLHLNDENSECRAVGCDCYETCGTCLRIQRLLYLAHHPHLFLLLTRGSCASCFPDLAFCQNSYPRCYSDFFPQHHTCLLLSCSTHCQLSEPGSDSIGSSNGQDQRYRFG
jgi:hypothetical protein